MTGKTPRKKIPLLILLSVLLVSFTGLMMQITLTRIFSAAMYYHYAFMAVSIALLGWGFGGIAMHFFKQRLLDVKLDVALIFLLAYSLSMPAYLAAVMQFHFSQNYINLFYLVSLIPFFFAGTALAFFYSEYAESVNKVYLADLAGASLACLLVEPVLVLLGAESTILFLAVVSSVACILMLSLLKKRKTISLGIIVLILTSSLFLVNVTYEFVSVSNPDKTLFKFLHDNPNLRISFTRWNSFSKVDAIEGFDGIVQAQVYIDAGASTDIIKWDGKIESIEYLKDTIDFLPYYLAPKSPKTLIIGSGGGRDVLVALTANSSTISAVELNPLVIEAVDKYKEETADPYSNNRTALFIDEGRSFIKRSNETFDVVTLTLVDSWAAISAGGYALAENYLYTKEAFSDYMNRLSDDGLLMMIRWEPEVPRLVSTATQMLAISGEDPHNAGKHLAVILHDVEPGIVRALFVLKKKSFTQAEAELLLNKTASLGGAYRPYYIPYVKEDVNPYSQLFNGSISPEQFCAAFSYRVDAVSDDSPYFFNIEKGIPKTLGDLTMLAFSLTILTIAAPLALGIMVRRRRMASEKFDRRPKKRFLPVFIVFFSALGIGYMLIEIATVQKFILFLGYPTRSLTVILFSLLLSSGVGSFVSGRLTPEGKNIARNIVFASLCIISIALAYVFVLPWIIGAFLPLDATVRVLITVLLVFPLGFLMGIPFPSGIRILHESSNGSIPWIWSINGTMSVLGSILATINGILIGFDYALLFGAVAYFVVLICALSWKQLVPGSSIFHLF